MNQEMASVAELGQYRFCRLGIDDVDEILAIEEAVYTHPWTRGNFLDSFYDHHEAWGIRDQQENLVAYFFLMPVVDELHLLTFAVHAHKQQLGYAYIMLREMQRIAQQLEFLSIMLEVRVSNARAIAIYERFGFCEIGRRKSYYPAHDGQREDAIVMRIDVSAKQQ